jgi:pentatricopeptide repeat protein
MEAIFRQLLLGEFVPNVISWNTLLKGYGEAQRMKALDDTLRKMTLAGVEPDTVRAVLRCWLPFPGLVLGNSCAKSNTDNLKGCARVFLHFKMSKERSVPTKKER